MQDPTKMLTILSVMARKPEVQFDNLFPKLYNINLWLMAYGQTAPKPGNMTAGTDGQTIDRTSLNRIEKVITDLKAGRYRPQPVRRVYIPKPNGKMRPLGIPCFEDKLLQLVVKYILEAIYEPTFLDCSHGFRPQRSCHTALEHVKKMTGVRWWIEGDIKGFFDNLNHDTLLHILRQRITDNRFIHLVGQFLQTGYIEDWQYHKTYSGTPQGGNLSPLLSNIYLNELDRVMQQQIAAFNRGKRRRVFARYTAIRDQKGKAKRQARRSGNWRQYKALQKELTNTECTDPQDPHFRRLMYVRYADDFLIGVVGSKAEAEALKTWLAVYLKTILHLELSLEKTLITNAKAKVRFLGYDIQRWQGTRIVKVRDRARGVVRRRTTNYHMKLVMPFDKVQAFAQEYGSTNHWEAKHRTTLLHHSELEIMMIFNAEIRGFLNYYALADNLSAVASNLLWLTTNSFLKTVAAKRQCSARQVVVDLKTGANTFTIVHPTADEASREYQLLSSTRQLKRRKITYTTVDNRVSTSRYRNPTDLVQRLLANECEWCGTREGLIEVHHIRKLKDLKGKQPWEIQMIARRRKTMVLCQHCHDELHLGRLNEATCKTR